MPVADVSDLMSKRNLVEETQGWMSLALQKKELALKELEKKKKDQLQPFEWDLKDWGSDNPYFQDQLQDLSQDYYNNVYAMAPYLNINPNDMENCPPGSKCAQAHRLKNTLDGTPGAFKAFQSRFQKDYDSAIELINDKDSEYYNVENLSILENAKGEWYKGFRPTYGPDGKLMAIVTEKVPVPQEDESGNPIYETEAGGTTTNKDDAKLDNDGNPIQATKEQDQEKVITLDDYYDKLGLNNLKKNASSNDWDPENFSKMITEDTSFILSDGSIDKNNPNYKKTYNNLHGAIFGTGDTWNNDAPEGGLLTSNAAPIISMMRNDPSGTWKDDTPITKDEIIDYVIQNTMGIGAEDDDSQGYTVQDQIDIMLGNTGSLNGQNFSGVTPKDDSGWGTPDSPVENNIDYIASFDIDRNKAQLDTEVLFTPENVTLLNGHDIFVEADGKINEGGKGRKIKTEFGDVVLSLYDTKAKRFISQADYDDYGDEQKANCVYKPAIYATFTTDDDNVLGYWKEKGLIEGQGGQLDNSSLEGLVSLDTQRNNVSSEGDSASPNYVNTQAIYELAEQKTRELLEGVSAPDSGTVDPPVDPPEGDDDGVEYEPSENADVL